MFDERTRHLRKLRQLRGSARRWTVVAAAFIGVTAILAPYQGLGPGDAVWAGLAGAAAAMTWWRWSDARQLGAQPVPDPPDPALATDRWLEIVSQLPGGYSLAQHVRRQRTRTALRGSQAAQAWERLDRAANSLLGLRGRLGAAPEGTLAEATKVERGLRELTDRIASLERAIRSAPAEAVPPLQTLRDSYLTQLAEGVSTYEQFVVAAAGWLAESERLAPGHPAVAGLTDATDRLRGVTEGLIELRNLERELRAPG